LITSTANRLQPEKNTSLQPESVSVPPATPSATAAPNNEKLDRSDSHDSLQSYVNVKENTSTNTSPQSPQQSGAGWGEYLSSWIKKPATATVADQKKQD
jgi:hypothetical protein